MPDEIRERVLRWVGCVAGALEENEYRSKLTTAGFENVTIEPTRVYKTEDALQFLSESGLDTSNVEAMDGKIMAAFVRATKPVASPVALPVVDTAAKTCCGPDCCS